MEQILVFFIDNFRMNGKLSSLVLNSFGLFVQFCLGFPDSASNSEI